MNEQLLVEVCALSCEATGSVSAAQPAAEMARAKRIADEEVRCMRHGVAPPGDPATSRTVEDPTRTVSVPEARRGPPRVARRRTHEMERATGGRGEAPTPVAPCFHPAGPRSAAMRGKASGSSVRARARSRPRSATLVPRRCSASRIRSRSRVKRHRDSFVGSRCVDSRRSRARAQARSPSVSSRVTYRSSSRHRSVSIARNLVRAEPPHGAPLSHAYPDTSAPRPRSRLVGGTPRLSGAGRAPRSPSGGSPPCGRSPPSWRPCGRRPRSPASSRRRRGR